MLMYTALLEFCRSQSDKMHIPVLHNEGEA